MRDLNALIAAAIPVSPPDEWFENPGLAHPHPIKVTPEGRVFGHVAAWDMDHIGMPFGTRPPRSRTNYAYFKTGELELASGNMIAVGQLTLAGGHAGLEASAQEAVKHYDDTASAIADVTAGEDAHGIWVAGALRPDATPEKIRALRASAPSGDWRQINGRLEMVAVCQVNVPGFPVPRARVASGAPVALVAAGTAPLLAQIMLEPEFIARLERLEEAERLREAAEHALVASAVRERVAAARQERLRRSAEAARLRVKDPARARQIERATLLASASREVPPKSARDAMERALKWVADGKGGDGLEPATVRRARAMVKGTKPSDATIKRMASFFARHKVDSKADGWNSGSENYPTPGRVAWDLWGGDAAARWAAARSKTLTAGGPPAKTRDKLAGEGKALPDGSFPIRNVGELKKAISAYGRAGNKARARQHIIKRARALNRYDLIPDDWSEKTAALTAAFEHLGKDFLSEKAEKQERDKFGRFIEENALVRFKDRDGRYRYGRAIGMSGQMMRVQTDDGVRSVRPGDLETVQAVLPPGQTDDSYGAGSSSDADFAPATGDGRPLRVADLREGERIELKRSGTDQPETYTVVRAHDGSRVTLRGEDNNLYNWAVDAGIEVQKSLQTPGVGDVSLASSAGTVIDLPVGRNLTFYAVCAGAGEWKLLDSHHRTFAKIDAGRVDNDEELQDVIMDEYEQQVGARPVLDEQMYGQAVEAAAQRANDDAEDESPLGDNDDYRDWETEVAELEIGRELTDDEWELLVELGVLGDDLDDDAIEDSTDSDGVY